MKTTDENYEAFQKLVKTATKEQLIDYIYEIVPQMCTEDTWAEMKKSLDELTDTLNYMSQWNRVRDLLQQCKDAWTDYYRKIHEYECYLKARKVKERYDAEGGKKGTGFSFPEYISEEEADGVSEKIINSAGVERENPITTQPSIFYETMEEVLKETEPARQGLKCARIETLRELLTILVNGIEPDGTSKYNNYNLMIYNIEARKADHRSESIFQYRYNEVEEKSVKLLKEQHDIHSKALACRKRIEQ